MNIRVLIILFVLTVAEVTLAAAAPVRLAILPGEGERAPAEEVIAQLEVTLTEEEDVTLLERAEVRKILREQNLSASGLTDPATAIRVGELLSVELFLFVEKIPNTDPAACRIQVIETKTGIALASALDDAQHIAEAPAAVMKTVRLALAKQRVPMENRHYVGILGVRNEEPGALLDGFAAALSFFLANDLVDFPNVIVLDREHLGRLSDEEKLTAVELELRKSSVLIDGGIRRVPGSENLNLNLTLRQMSTGQSHTSALQIPHEDVSRARGQIAEAIVRSLGTKELEFTPGDPETEAKAFLRQVRYLPAQDPQARLRIAEAAYALWPSVETRRALCGAWSGLSYSLSSPIWQRGKDTGVATKQDKIRALNARLRALALRDELLRDEIRRQEKEGKYGSLSERGWREGFGIVLVPDEGEVLRLQKEAAQIESKLFRLQLQFYERHYEECSFAYWDLWRHGWSGMGFRWPGQAEDKVAWLRKYIDALADPPGKAKTADAQEWISVQDGITSGVFTCLQLEDNSHDRKVYTEFFRRLTSHKDPFARLIAYRSLIHLQDDRNDAPEAILRIISEEFLRENMPSRPAEVALIEMRDPVRVSMWGERLLGPWLDDEEEGWRLAHWRSSLETWLNALAKLERYEQADAVAEKAIARLNEWAPKWRTAEVNRIVRNLEARRATYAQKLDRPPQGNAAWSDYTLIPLELAGLATPPQAAIRGNRLYCVMGSAIGEDRSVEVVMNTYKIPQGGTPVSSVSITVPTKGRPWFHRAGNSLALAENALYVATDGGLVVFDLNGKPARLLTEADGLPADEIKSLGWCRGKLYMGMVSSWTQGKSGFACYDLKTGKCQLIASSQSKRKRNALDGRSHLLIWQILADEKRHCLWFGLDDAIWRYFPETGEFEESVKLRFALSPHGTPALWWCGNNIMYRGLVGLLLLDPDTLSKTWLLSTTSTGARPAGYEGEALFGNPGVDTCPAAYDGEHLFTGGRGPLRLHVKGFPPVPSQELNISKYGRLIYTRHGLLAIPGNGKAWLIRKRK